MEGALEEMTILFFALALFMLIIVFVMFWVVLIDIKRQTKRLEALERARQIFCRDLVDKLTDDLEDAMSRMGDK